MSDEQLIKSAQLFKVLGDPNRLTLLNSLANCEMTVTELCQKHNLEQSYVSHQLKILREHHLIKYRKVGRSHEYTIDDHHIHTILEQVYIHISERSSP